MATAAPKIDLAQIAANMRTINPNLPSAVSAPTTPAPPGAYNGTTSNYKPTTAAPAYTGTTSNYTPAPPGVSSTPAPPINMANASFDPWRNAPGPIGPGTQYQTTPAPPQTQQPVLHNYSPVQQPAAPPVPQTPPAPTMQQTPAPPNLYKDPYARTPESIAALAKERVAKILQAGKTSADGALAGAKNAYDYTNQIEGDSRTLRNSEFKETNNPFSGKTGYLASNMLRNDSIADTAQDRDYNAQVGLINQKLADLQAAAPGDEQQIIDELQQIERQTGISVAQLQMQQQGQAFNQTMQTNQFNRGILESDRGYGLDLAGMSGQLPGGGQTLAAQGQNFNQGIAAAGLTGQYNGQTTVQQQQNQFNNGLDMAAVTGNYNGQRTLAGQSADLNNQGQSLQNELARMKIDNYPAEAQAAAQQVQQQLQAGQLDIDTATFKLEQLKDPESPVNKASQIEMQLKQLELQYAGPEAQARIDQIRKATAQIGAAPYQSDLDKKLDQVRLEAAQEELKQMKTPQTPKGKTAEDYYKFLDDSMFVTPEYTNPTDGYSQPTKTGKTAVSDKDGMEAYIYSLNLSNEETYKLLRRYKLVKE